MENPLTIIAPSLNPLAQNRVPPAAIRHHRMIIPMRSEIIMRINAGT
jgi:hypothetical protein